ncbi:MAG: hypothetical protein ABEJ65_05395 [bacterium]
MKSITARSPHCFSRRYVVKKDDQVIGEYKRRIWNSSLKLRLTDKRQYLLRKTNWLSSDYEFIRKRDGKQIGTAGKQSMLSSTWEIKLFDRVAHLESKGMLNSRFHLVQNQHKIEEANRRGTCENGWEVQGKDGLQDEFLVFTGLVFQFVLNRRRAAGASAASAT